MAGWFISWKMIGKEDVVTYSRHFSGMSLRRLKKTPRRLSQERQYPGPYANWTPLDFTSRELPPEQHIWNSLAGWQILMLWVVQPEEILQATQITWPSQIRPVLFTCCVTASGVNISCQSEYFQWLPEEVRNKFCLVFLNNYSTLTKYSPPFCSHPFLSQLREVFTFPKTRVI
jgi:hypothetical protein